MKMSFLPGELQLSEERGVFIVSVKSQEVLRTRSQKAAVAKFNAIRGSMENQFPHRETTQEEKQALLRNILNDAAVDETLRRPPKKRSTARSSRTFGG